MKNCEITSFVGSVDNSSLSKIGVLTIDFKAPDSPSASSNALYLMVSMDSVAGATKLKVVSGNGRIYTSVPSDWNDHSGGVSEVTLARGGTNTYYISNADTVLELNNKYEITSINCAYTFGFNCSELFVPKLTTFEGRFYKGIAEFLKEGLPSALDSFASKVWDIYKDIDINANIPYALVGKDIKAFNLNKSDCKIDIAELLSGCTNVTTFGAPNSQIKGNLSYFLVNGGKRFPNLTTINVASTPNIIKNTADVTALRNLGVTVTTR